MLPWVFIDVGAESDQAARWVERACNRAIIEARCTTDPGAVLLPEVRARVLRSRSRGVRIEVDVVAGDNGPRMRARELAFKRQDPERERWRSVGLVVATLVGEIQRDLSAPEASRPAPGAPGLSEVPEQEASPAQSESPRPPAPPAVSSEQAPSPEAASPPLTLAEALGSEPQAESPSPVPGALARALEATLPARFWVGVGAALVSGRGDASGRVGAAVEGHALWLQPVSLHLALRYGEGRLNASGAQPGDGVEALGERELVALGGLGLWVPAGSRAAIRLGASLGARYQTFDSQLETRDYRASVWLPDVRGSVGFWLSVAGGMGLWLSADASTGLAASRVVDERSGAVLARVPPAQLGVTAGLGWGR